jgi:hypothetical protein
MQLTVKNVNVKESDESKAPLSGIARNVPLLHVKHSSDRVESDDLFEEVEVRVTDSVMSEVADRGRARPGDNGYQQNAEDDGTLDAVHHQKNRNEPTTENTDPHGRIPHLGASWADTGFVHQGLDTSAEFQRGSLGACNSANTSRISKSNKSEVKTDSDTGSKFDASWNSPLEIVSVSCAHLAERQSARLDHLLYRGLTVDVAQVDGGGRTKIEK